MDRLTTLLPTGRPEATVFDSLAIEHLEAFFQPAFDYIYDHVRTRVASLWWLMCA